MKIRINTYRKLTIPVLVILLIVNTILKADDRPEITFFIGKVKITSGSGKKMKPSIGMKLDAKCRIRTYRGSFLELKIGSRKLNISENTNISCRSIMGKSVKRKSHSRSSVISGLRKIIKGNTRVGNVTHIMAVRAREKGDDLSWDDGSGKSGEEENLVFEGMVSEYKSGKYNKVIGIYKKNAGILKRKQRDSMYIASFAYMKLGMYSESAKSFERLVKGKKDRLTPLAIFNAGLAFYCVPDHKKSIGYLSRYIKYYPKGINSAEALYLRGKSYSLTGKKDMAEKDFRMIVKKFPNSPVAKDAEMEVR